MPILTLVCDEKGVGVSVTTSFGLGRSDGPRPVRTRLVRLRPGSRGLRNGKRQACERSPFSLSGDRFASLSGQEVPEPGNLGDAAQHR